ncbi:TIGR00341 family protein [Nocardiopsis sp. NRRL B-16309]|uniref:TIGR00341 family protein n=1 Tax=Nocardiopsis sp. NRRL B-16309 TaxID=1519494 RepID=UPI0006AE2F1D|nr:TIGR00341 family protein [Nocardiopsis sp. NRRL B-16309]KOX17044.1 membrane protein [Nocardiopsis sp. NRRL B-16309]
MRSGILGHVLPVNQRRSLDELADGVDLSAGDSRSKRSAFWTMLTLSAVIAAGGVLTDSTATVIGAMIIAPLSTPIMGIALGVVQKRRTGSVRVVVFGCLLVITVGLVFSWVMPGGAELLGNSQISGRTSPGLIDLVSAMATGLAGAVALSRKDVAAVLPGVAIAISLVPPLVVVGVCLGHGAFWLALGALVLFLSNLLALVFAGMVVFAASGYSTPENRDTGHSSRRAYTGLALLFTAVLLLLVANTTLNVLIHVWTGRGESAAQEWLADEPTATVTGVTMHARTLHVDVRTREDLPPTDDLVARLDTRIPAGIPVVVETTRGQRVDAGQTGS